MIFSTDASGRFVYLSGEWSEITGQDRSAALGLGWLDRVPETDRATIQDVFSRAAAAVSEFSLRFRLHCADGSVRWLGAGGLPSFGPPDSTFLGYLGSMIEMTPSATDGMQAYGHVGRYLPPPTHHATAPQDHLDRIADHLIIAHSLIEGDGAKSALPGLRAALFEVGRAIARRSTETPNAYN
ncbi:MULTISPECIES: PAS domain-containing protein [Methylobacterium]|jgi:PAS domain S-box-containing protein|uniref:PAS domain-containing protein n=1 Tax=Methylobacterium TaxID=407 RepID=UPI0011C76307|nr:MULTISPECIES: PAS domain-containing protein [Methylobacterium]TXN62054.1 PAS domain-containing protein [Methylobacterium sp. WL18]GJE23498.1 hypothetical protein JHFBIEKO_3961 [Methylobacterium mesophilicum]